MAMVTKNEYGMVAINGNVLCKLVIDEILAMEDRILPCNRKGKVLKKSLFTGYHEMLAAVELKEEAEGISVRIYLVVRFGERISDVTNKLFDAVERDFRELCLDPPVEIAASIKGVLSRQLAPRDVEVVRRND